MSRHLLAIVATALLWQSCLAAKSVLVLVPDAKAADSYSQFLDSLRGAGFTLDVKGVRDSSLKLREYGVWAYDNLALLAPKAESELFRMRGGSAQHVSGLPPLCTSDRGMLAAICTRLLAVAYAGFGGSLDAQTILDFVDSGHNVLLAASSDVSEAMRNLAAEFGVDLDDKGTKVFDHFGHGSVNGAEDHTLVASSDLVDSPVMTGGPYTVRSRGGGCLASGCPAAGASPMQHWSRVPHGATGKHTEAAMPPLALRMHQRTQLCCSDAPCNLRPCMCVPMLARMLGSSPNSILHMQQSPTLPHTSVVHAGARPVPRRRGRCPSRLGAGAPSPGSMPHVTCYMYDI